MFLKNLRFGVDKVSMWLVTDGDFKHLDLFHLYLFEEE